MYAHMHLTYIVLKLSDSKRYLFFQRNMAGEAYLSWLYDEAMRIKGSVLLRKKQKLEKTVNSTLKSKFEKISFIDECARKYFVLDSPSKHAPSMNWEWYLSRDAVLNIVDRNEILADMSMTEADLFLKDLFARIKEKVHGHDCFNSSIAAALIKHDGDMSMKRMKGRASASEEERNLTRIAVPSNETAEKVEADVEIYEERSYSQNEARVVALEKILPLVMKKDEERIQRFKIMHQFKSLVEICRQLNKEMLITEEQEKDESDEKSDYGEDNSQSKMLAQIREDFASLYHTLSNCTFCGGRVNISFEMTRSIDEAYTVFKRCTVCKRLQ